MSKQTESLSKSCPLSARAWSQVGERPGEFEFLIVSSPLPPAQWDVVRREGCAFVPHRPPSAKQFEFPSLTAALRASEAILKARGFEKRGTGDSERDESGHWGIWRVSGHIKEGKFSPSPGGKEVGYFGVIPVRKVAEVAEAPKQSKPKPKAKSESGKSSVPPGQVPPQSGSPSEVPKPAAEVEAGSK